MVAQIESGKGIEMQASLTRTGVLGRPSVSRTTEDLVSREVLDVLIRRECARADRNERQFSLVLFRLPNSKRNAVSTQRLIRTILARARMTDEVGWFSAHYLCCTATRHYGSGAPGFFRWRVRHGGPKGFPSCHRRLQLSR